MVRKLENYFDFAENDYMYFQECYRAGMVFNQMGAIAQGICEKYLKHIIEEYVPSDSEEAYSEKERVLRTHSLTRLTRYMMEELPEFEIDRQKLRIIDGLYFSTRYPGDDSICVGKEELDECQEAVLECREKTVAFMELKKAQGEGRKAETTEVLDALPQKPGKSPF